MLELFFSDYRPYAQDVIAWLVCCSALIWGGTPERIVAATWLILFEIGTVAHGMIFGEARQLETIDWYFASIDLLAGAIWLGVALYANRNYPLWIAAMQILAVVAHLSRGLTEVITPIAYAVMVIAPGWFQLIFLAIGLIRHVRRKREYGDYRDWRIIRHPNSLHAVLAKASEASWRDAIK